MTAGRRLAIVGVVTAVTVTMVVVGMTISVSGPDYFLVLMGECVLIIEDQERHLRAWDFVHCPPMTGHTLIAKETGPCVILATGNRREDLERISPRSEAALRYHAGTEVDGIEPERRGRWVVQRPKDWDELPWAERP